MHVRACVRAHVCIVYMCVVCACTCRYNEVYYIHDIIGFSGDVSCFNGEGCSAAKGGDCGGRDCYALAFGVPAILMTIAIIIFIAGSQMYIKNKPPGGNNIFSMFFGCLWVCHTLVYLTSFVTRGLIRAQFQDTLFITIQ